MFPFIPRRAVWGIHMSENLLLPNQPVTILAGFQANADADHLIFVCWRNFFVWLP
jgi:hypothetical protein